MAKKLTVTASKNGAGSSTKDVFFRNTEAIDLGPLTCFRVWSKFDKGLDDTLEISAVTIQTGVSDPITGFDDPDWYKQISLAFID
jgi:hypothetical protein